jgi:peptidoglycan/LPS O-acetylase OafA/YrhL
MPQVVPTKIPAAPVSPRKALYIPSLDGIRAASFMLVFFAHAGLDKKIPGGLGVTIFFFLSGFLITTLLRTEADQNGHISIRDFYIRRVLRIFPPFYLAIFLGALLHWTGILEGPIGNGALMQSLHLGNYWTIFRQTHGLSLDGIARGSNVLWSLAVEEHFYLLFPVLYVVLRKRFNSAGQTTVLAVICGLILLWRCVLVLHFHVADVRTFCGTDTRADSILWGCIFAIACNPVLDRPRVLGMRLIVLFLLAICAMAATLRIRDERFRETLRYTLQGLILFPVFTAAIIYHESPLFRWLNWKPVRRLGLLSYSLYLVHYTVIYVVAAHLKSTLLVQGIVSFVISLAVSLAFFHGIERPCARLRKRFSHASASKVSAAAPVLPRVNNQPSTPVIDSRQVVL